MMHFGVMYVQFGCCLEDCETFLKALFVFAEIMRKFKVLLELFVVLVVDVFVFWSTDETSEMVRKMTHNRFFIVEILHAELIIKEDRFVRASTNKGEIVTLQ